ncbi:MAG: hypothetical protein HFG55_04095 [Lachnospiraceae bacterium]|nr:hypothetical protein [Lachnospiraceae bacterium]
MGLERIGGPRQESKSPRQEKIEMLRQQGKQLPSSGGMNRTSKLFVQTVTRNRGGLSKSQIQKKLQKIKNKLRSGARLTGEEKAFLQEHAPELYRKVIALERERAAYEEQLKAAKTRDEAENIRMNRMSMAVAAGEKKDAEFEMIRMAQLQAAEAETKMIVLSKPWKHEQDRERREKLERAAKKQVNTERRMKRLRRWNNGKVEEVVSGENNETKAEQGTSEQMLSEKTKADQETIRLVEARMAVLGGAVLAQEGMEFAQAVDISQGKAAYSAMTTQVTEEPPKENKGYIRKA